MARTKRNQNDNETTPAQPKNAAATARSATQDIEEQRVPSSATRDTDNTDTTTGLDPVIEENIEAIRNSSTVKFGENDEGQPHARNHDPLHKPVVSKEEIHPVTKHVTPKKTAGTALAREEAEQRAAAAERRRAEREGVVDVTEESATAKRKLDEIATEAAVNVTETVEFLNEKLFPGNPNTALSADHAIKKARPDVEESDLKVDAGNPNTAL